MWSYAKKLQFPVKIAQTNPQLAKIIITQYGGPDGELGASLRYLSQRFAMPYAEVKGILTDIGISGSKCSVKDSSVLLDSPGSPARTYAHLYGSNFK